MAKARKNNMTGKSWLIISIFYVLISSAIVLLSYYLGHVLLQMPTGFVFLLAGLSLIAFTIGMVSTLLIAYIKRKRQ